MKKTRRIKNLLPKLKINDVNKTHKYHLHYPQEKEYWLLMKVLDKRCAVERHVNRSQYQKRVD